jgi:threonine/homoserine efflux transporter RhtA
MHESMDVPISPWKSITNSSHIHIGHLPVQTVAILGYLEPLSALFFSAAFLGKTLSFLQLIGAVLILGGAAFGELFRQKQVLGLAVRVE